MTPGSGGLWAPQVKGTYSQCTRCKDKRLMHEGRCVVRDECPFENARYILNTYGGTCEAPFACLAGKKVGGANQGKNCKCINKGSCSDCSWSAGGAYQCIRCKNRKYLFNGQCIGAEECALGNGGTPIEGEDGRGGGVCVDLGP
jgi:hypothetical protein